MSKKTVVFVIDTFRRGGAEMLLVNLLPEYNKKYNVILVNLSPGLQFPEGEILCEKRYVLNHNHHWQMLRTVGRLKRIFERHKPDLIRTDLYWSTIVARLAKPAGTPLLTVIHNTLSNDAFLKNRKSLWLEDYTKNRSDVLLAVSETVIQDYERFIKGSRAKKIVLKNYVSDVFMNQPYSSQINRDGPIRLVNVANLKLTKNQDFLLEVMRGLDPEKYNLDIIGEGVLRKDLEEKITRYKLPVRLLGLKNDLHKILVNYEAFIMSSIYEGLPVSTMEAMAIGLPLILNDIPVMREVSGGNALFYEDGCVESCVNQLKQLPLFNGQLSHNSLKLKSLARMHYSRSRFFEKITGIMDEAMKISN